MPRLSHGKSLWFSYSILFFFALLYDKGEERVGMKGKWIWRQLYFCSCGSDLCLSWALSSVRQSKSTVTLRVLKKNWSFHTFRKHIQVMFKVPFSCRRYLQVSRITYAWWHVLTFHFMPFNILESIFLFILFGAKRCTPPHPHPALQLRRTWVVWKLICFLSIDFFCCW